MQERTLMNGQLVEHWNNFLPTRATNGLTAVKLARLRDVLTREAKSVTQAFDEIGQRHAVRDASDRPMVHMRDGEPLSVLPTRTPFYVIDPKQKDEATREAAELNNAPVTITIPETLTPADLANIISADPAVDIGPVLIFLSQSSTNGTGKHE